MSSKIRQIKKNMEAKGAPQMPAGANVVDISEIFRDYGEMTFMLNRANRAIEHLQKQLAAKDEEIEKLKERGKA